jgi:hypothetical protein
MAIMVLRPVNSIAEEREVVHGTMNSLPGGMVRNVWDMPPAFRTVRRDFDLIRLRIACAKRRVQDGMVVDGEDREQGVAL